MSRRPRVAAIVTEYRPASHADVIVTRLLAGYTLDGVPRPPAVEVAALYVDQVPPNDMSSEMSTRYGVPIFRTIREALTLGGSRLAVDGVLLIGEHGRYPFNEMGQQLYPRFRFFNEAVAAMRESGRTVPLFSDKHLSYSWTEGKLMYDTAQSLGVPMMAGSVLPLTWRQPPLELPLGCQIQEALAVGYGGLEAYGFHALEMLQCMVERRGAGEVGVAAVRCLTGEAVWEAADAGVWSKSLFEAALRRVPGVSTDDPRRLVREPAAFLIEYRDGLQATVLMLNGWVRHFAFAALLPGQPEPLATLFWLDDSPPYQHFSFLAYEIERLMLARRPSYPLERTLLTTGVLAALMLSRHQGGRRVETPHLAISYLAPPAPVGAMALPASQTVQRALDTG